MSRRRFLQSAAATAAGAGVVGTVAATARATSGSDFSIQGVDVSHYQGSINWTSVKNSGKTFAFMKATEGTTYTDPTFATNWAGAKAAGLIRGAYHFGHPGSSAVDQANRFCNVVAPTHGDLQMMLDLEVTDGVSPSGVRSWVVAFINQIVSRTGRPGIIYTGFYFWRDSAGNGSNLNCPLFLAAYVTDPNNFVPAAWPFFTFWQYTDAGTCPGISGNVDRDAFNGSTSGLNALRLP
jgi:GH25 family lysozyme M1 (1,4-beta-N-acetylmuramidase)